MLKYFRLQDLGKALVVIVVAHCIGMSLFHELIGINSIISSVLSFVGTIFALYKLRSYVDVNIEVKPRKQPL